MQWLGVTRARLLIRFAIVLEPPRFVLTAWIAMRPMNHTTSGVPFIHTIEGYRISFLQRRNSRSKVNVVRNQQGLTGIETKNEALMTTSIVVIGQNSIYKACTGYLKATPLIPERRHNSLVACA